MNEIKEFMEAKPFDFANWLTEVFNDAYIDENLTDVSDGMDWLLNKYVNDPEKLEVVNNTFVALSGYGLVALINKAKETAKLAGWDESEVSENAETE